MNPPPTSLPITSLWVIPMHQLQACCILQNNCIYLGLCCVAVSGASSGLGEQGCSLAVMYRLLIAVTFSGCETRALGNSGFSGCSMYARYLQLPGSGRAGPVVHRLICSMACWIFQDQG